MSTFPITPGTTVQLDCTQTTGRVALGSVGKTLLVQNSGTAMAWVKAGDSTVTASAAASTTSYPILGGAILSWTVNDAFTHVAGICASGQTTSVFLTRGEGA